ncbi:MAG: folate-binding protein YgfZ, partial [Gammaproteobacteria bacterium]
MLIALPPPQLIEISGTDAVAFAHAQFSSDVTALGIGQWQWSAWLNAQGRVRAFFHLLRIADDKLWLCLRGGDAQRLRDALVRYVLRAKVNLRIVEDMQAFAAHDQADLPDTPLAADKNSVTIGGGRLSLALPGMPSRWLLLAPSAQMLAADASDVARERARRTDIDAGLVWLDSALDEKLLPQWLGFDALGATSVRKGCYPGQEVVARLHFKGGSKRTLYRLRFQTATLPGPGAAVHANGPVGEGAGLIVNSAWREPGHAAALAVLSEDT